MKKLSSMVVIVILGFAQRAHAFCVPGDEQACVLNGKHGTRTCGSNGMYGPCVVPSDPPPPSGYAHPRYKILTVVYAPPGRQGGGSQSSVVYGSGSTWGSTSSCTSSFKQGYSATVTATGGFLSSSTASLLFSYGRSSADSTATEIKKSASSQISQAGPAVDGIDHDRDEIWLWLNPKLYVSLPNATSIEWQVDGSQPMDVQFLYVGWLKNPSQIPQFLADHLAALGFTADDYAEILRADPFASGSTEIDPQRYVSLNTTFPYEPPFAPGDPGPTLNFNATYSSTTTTGHEVQSEIKAGVTWEGGLSFITLVEAKLKVAGEWTWTDKTSTTDSSGTTETATVTVGSPSFGYTGPTDIAVYYDVIYKSFVFAPYEGFARSPVQGWIYSRSNRDVAGQEVVLVDARGVRHRTFADASGEFRILDAPGGRARLLVGGVSTDVPASADPVDIELP
ncbi:MAG TPA: hypothetical protein VKB80_15920 [Kofleriaceae bacterium]|nr:hypothetical protein [Kofleriaceae bacterium]